MMWRFTRSTKSATVTGSWATPDRTNPASTLENAACISSELRCRPSAAQAAGSCNNQPSSILELCASVGSSALTMSGGTVQTVTRTPGVA